MAHFTQEKKAVLVQRLKEEFPGWSFGVKVLHHATVVVQIKKAPIDLLTNYKETYKGEYENNYEGAIRLNHYWLGNAFSGEVLVQIQKLMDVINLKGTKFANHDRSDSQTDYYDVGFYTSLILGFNDKKFEYVAKK